ncbi:MAG TPA: molybdopterin-dependent oxidoreductase [Jiangellaceae bacterium]
MEPRRYPLHIYAAAALAGLVTGGLIVAVGMLVARLVAPQTGPFLVVGNTIVDRTPEWLKSFAIETFGANDKLVLLISLGVVLAGLSALAGVLQLRRPPLGIILGILLGLVAIAAALTRPGADLSYAVPTVAGLVAGGPALWFPVRRLRDVAARGGPVDSGEGAPELRGSDRRRFLLLTAGAAGLALAAALSSRQLGQTLDDVLETRDRIRLPAPEDLPPEVPPSADFDISGITPYVSSNEEFYRVDTALEIPRVDPATWQLRIHGMVDREIRLAYSELLDLPMIERLVTLTCVSNQVGGDLADNAAWLGHPVRELLERAQPHADADMVLSRSIDGFTASTPLEVLQDGRDAMLAVGMNGRPLPLGHGFPVRMVVPGLYGYVSATKWIVEMEVTRFDRATAYWTDRGWAPRGPIKTASRIDVPGSSAQVSAGEVTVAGVAWAQHRGISRVEVSVDDGLWREAELADEVSVDTWRQWRWTWDARPGRHTLRVRATDGDGELQTSEEVEPFPDGATGWHSRVVEVV